MAYQYDDFFSNPGSNSSSGGTNWQNFLGPAGQGIGSLLQLFGPNPANEAMKYLDQVPGAIDQQYSPYTQAGAKAIGRLGSESETLTGLRPDLMAQIQKILQNPGAFMNTIGEGYKESPGYRFNVNEATKGANAAAAAGGMAGSPAHQQETAQMVGNLANQDYNHWLTQALGTLFSGLGSGQGLYGAGLGGLQGISGLGAQAATNQAEQIQKNLENKANVAGANSGNTLSGLAGGANALLSLLSFL